MEICRHDEQALADTQPERSLHVMSQESNHCTQGTCAFPACVKMLIYFYHNTSWLAGIQCGSGWLKGPEACHDHKGILDTHADAEKYIVQAMDTKKKNNKCYLNPSAGNSNMNAHFRLPLRGNITIPSQWLRRRAKAFRHNVKGNVISTKAYYCEKYFSNQENIKSKHLKVTLFKYKLSN